MRWAFMVVRRSAYVVFWLGNMNERDHLEDMGIDGRIILKWIFRRIKLWRSLSLSPSLSFSIGACWGTWGVR
jgi:hypothetical protein